MTSGSYIYGRNAVIEAISSGGRVEKIFLLYGIKGDSVRSVYSLAKKNKIPCVTYDKSKFIKLERAELPKGAKAQGVIALIRPFSLLTIEELIEKSFKLSPKPVIVLLDGITDPHNFGAIARSAECSGAAGIITTERNSAPVTPAAIKASAGALQFLPAAKAVNLINAIEKLKEAGFFIAGTSDKAEKKYDEPDWDFPTALIIGSEGKGMRPSTEKHCDLVIRIPLYGKISSLNASVAAGITLFAIARRKNQD